MKTFCNYVNSYYWRETVRSYMSFTSSIYLPIILKAFNITCYFLLFFFFKKP
jgi:hypothetical protein